MKFKTILGIMSMLLLINLYLWGDFSEEAILSSKNKSVLNLSGEISDSLKLKVKITPGNSWIHKLKIMPLIKVKNRPQMAIWLENPQGDLLKTIMVTERVANGNWRKAPFEKVGDEGIKRPSALPIWISKSKKRVINHDELNLITCATPQRGLYLEESLNLELPLIIKLEVNHSTDFNDFYSKKATPGSPGYSNGKMGSGQPALVYGAMLIKDDIGQKIKLGLLGTSSPTGADGRLYDNLDNLTTAKDILSEITIILEKQKQK
jgi:hypothetical protein